jgi:serine/threonine-protein kinase
MRELAKEAPPPPSSARPLLAGAAATATPSPVSVPVPSGLRDPFGIVGTTQAETFHIEKVVAHGGFGVIYKARHVRFRAAVALKCLKIPANLSPSERTSFFERFRAEGEVMFRLSGSIPEVVRPMHVDALKLDDGRFVPFIALEWLEGETLKDVIVKRITQGKRPLSVSRAVVVLSQVARALSRAHHFPGPEGALAILHCDLKPDNLFVARTDGGDTFKIFDFGIAKVRSAATRVAGGATSADAASSMFTPAYAAPEQWAPDKYGQTGPWTDVFALALTLTELVTQRPAIDGPPAAMLAQCMDPTKRPTPRRLGLELPQHIDAIFAKGLAVDPKDRYQSIEQFWGDLERVLQLPPNVGGGSRMSIPAPLPLLPSGWELEEETAAAPIAAPPSVGAAPALEVELPSLDLELPVPPVRPPSAPPQAPAAPQSPFALGDLELAAPPAAPQHAPPQPSLGRAQSGAHAIDFEQPLDAGAFDLAADPARPAPPPAAASSSGMSAAGMAAVGTPMPGMPMPSQLGGPASLGDQQLGQPAGPAARERIQQAAAVAGAAAAKAAAVAGAAAASTAKSIAKKAIDVEDQVIRLDDPSTWIKPMRGPIIAMVLAIVLSIGVVVANKMTGARYSLTWLSLPLLLGAIGFAAYRWMKIQKR